MNVIKRVKTIVVYLLYKFPHYLINSIIYMLSSSSKTVLLNAWVFIKYGKVVHNNWGDDINVFLLEKISNKKVIVRNRSLFHQKLKKVNYICIGSILGWYENETAEIWGAGFISNDSTIQCKPKKVHSVRGKLTRQKLLDMGIDCPQSYGDPALLLSKFYTPNIVKRYKVGIVPHYVDYENNSIKEYVNNNVQCIVIKMKDYTTWTDVVDQICSCDIILSSSLHGLIVADSYGIPNVWVKFSDKINGGDFKYLDYFSSVHRLDSSPYDIKHSKDLRFIIEQNKDLKCNAKINFREILKACPFYYINSK